MRLPPLGQLRSLTTDRYREGFDVEMEGGKDLMCRLPVVTGSLPPT